MGRVKTLMEEMGLLLPAFPQGMDEWFTRIEFVEDYFTIHPNPTWMLSTNDHSQQQAVWRSTFSPDNANFAWKEYAIKNRDNKLRHEGETWTLQMNISLDGNEVAKRTVDLNSGLQEILKNLTHEEALAIADSLAEIKYPPELPDVRKPTIRGGKIT